MDLGNNSAVKTPETENETPTRIQTAKGSPFTNGVLKRHAPPQFHHLRHHHPIVVTYKECLKNHAAGLGRHAVDGCGEFMPSPNSNPAEPTSLKCAACGCHRNFHRREPDDPPTTLAPALEYHPLHRHHPPPPSQRGKSSGSPNNSPPSPPPISSSYYPNMLLALSHGNPENATPLSAALNAGASVPMFGLGGRKRYRTKFTQYQKEKMLELADRVGWKMQKRDEDLIQESCRDMGVEKGVFKVWMHNNKNTLGKKDQNQPQQITILTPAAANTNGNGLSHGVSIGDSAAYVHHRRDGSGDDIKLNIVDGRETGQFHLHDSSNVQGLVTNGSSSSS